MNNLITGILIGIGIILLSPKKQEKVMYKNNVYQLRKRG